MREKVLLTQALNNDGMQVLEKEVDIKILPDLSMETLEKEIEDSHAIIIRVGRLPGDVIKKAKNLQVIGRPGVGYDCIDLDIATQSGIPIVVVPGINHYSVAEHALTLMLALSKNLRLYDQELRIGNWDIRNTFTSFELKEKKIGIIGYGNIGSVLASYCKALGMTVSVYDPYVEDKVISADGFSPEKDLFGMLKKADVVSINCPLTESTKGLIGRNELSMMKESALLINCARGEIIDEGALIEALQKESIRGAGLDVFEEEPLTRNNPLKQMHNVIITPHSAALTKEVITKAHVSVAEGVLAVLRGGKWDNIVNQECYNYM